MATRWQAPPHSGGGGRGMGKRWRKYSVGKYRLGQLHDQAVVVWKDESGPHRRRLGVAASEVEARRLLDAWVRRVQVLRADSSVTVGEVYAAYMADRISDGKVAANFRDSWRALAPRFETMPVDAITADVCRDHARQRIAAGVSQGTIWTELTRLSSAVNWAARRRMIPAPPPYVWTPRKPAPRQRVLSPAEAIALIDACVMPHVRLFVVLALTTGARSGALLGLTWDRVDFDGGSIDLRERVTVDPLTKRARKGRAVAPMTSVARVALLEAREGALSDHVIEWDGQPVGLIRRGFMEAVGRAGLGTVTPMRMPNGKPYNKVVSDVTPHTLRHTATSWAVNSGASMEFAARLLGHRDPKTTRSTYAHADVDSLRPVADVIDMKIRRKG